MDLGWAVVDGAAGVHRDERSRELKLLLGMELALKAINCF